MTAIASASDRTIIQITRLYTVPTSNEELGDKFVLLFPKSAVADASGDVFVSDTNLNGLFRVRARDQVMVRIAGSSNVSSSLHTPRCWNPPLIHISYRRATVRLVMEDLLF